MIDANRDGIIDVGDLQSTFESLGVDSMDTKVLEGMVSEAPAQINFTVFLNMLADKLTGKWNPNFLYGSYNSEQVI